jgi:ADP-heptose:LPS heptosyltransferase
MHGLGDNLHQRALLKRWVQDFTVYLETSWVAVYHDFPTDRLRLLRKRSGLRTQAKNADREAAGFYTGPIPRFQANTRVWYPPESVRRNGAVLKAMCETVHVPYTTADFRMPVRPEWHDSAVRDIVTRAGERPILIYRPLVERTEWTGCPARNPDHVSYAALFDSVRDRFFVVSIADLEPGREWIAGLGCEADLYLHKGELPFESLAALTERAAMVFASPGFAIVLAQAVGTPSVCVYGGYEGNRTFDAGARFVPYLPISPVNPCACFTHGHDCDKRIDMPHAFRALDSFTMGVLAR